MRCHWLAGTLALAVAGSAVAAPAHADKPGIAAVNRAKLHFKKGRTLQRSGGYDAAINEYQLAYWLAPRPELLYDIAQCHRLAGHTREAIDYYQRFIEEAPEDPAVEEARTHITKLRRQLVPPSPPSPLEQDEADKSLVATPTPAAVPVEDHWPQPTDASSELMPELPPGSSVGESVPPALAEASHPMKWVGISTLATGAAIVGVGAFYGWRAAEAANTLEHSTGLWTPALAAREADARADERRMYYLAGGGGALVIVGAALWWWGRDDGVQARPTLTPGSAGLEVHGAF